MCFLFSEEIPVPTFELLTLEYPKNMEGIMLLDDAKKIIAEKLRSDADFRERVVEFILYRGFLSTIDNLKDVGEGVQTRYRHGNQSSHKANGFNSHLSQQDGHECPFTGKLHGYEYWVG